MTDLWDEHTIERPNWVDHIQHFFSSGDVQCMASSPFKLDDYESVRFNARRIYGVTEAGTMPMGAPERRWNTHRLGTFYNWMKNGAPRTDEEESVLERFRVDLNTSGEMRVRKNIADLDPGGAEMTLLKEAFVGIMQRPPGTPNSYFDIAGLHWFPAPATYCVHGEDRYNPWHRAYLLAFENALRSVPGCEDVTLPYWDIASGSVPDILFEAPFDGYQFPKDVEDDDGHVVAARGTSTNRFEKRRIEELITSQTTDISGDIQRALVADSWLGFNGLPPFTGSIISAHNSGHRACGATLSTPDTAAYDPLFWFFHCNWDRLWWQWQRNAEVQRLSDFRDLLARNRESDQWLDDPVIGMIEPFGVLSNVTIDSAALGVDYEMPQSAPLSALWAPVGRAASSVSLASTDKVQVKLLGFNRLMVRGSVLIELLANDEVVADHYIFQSRTPEKCPTCLQHGVVDVDFELHRHRVEGTQVSVRVFCVNSEGSSEIALSECGSPQLSIVLPLLLQ